VRIQAQKLADIELKKELLKTQQETKAHRMTAAEKRRAELRTEMARRDAEERQSRKAAETEAKTKHSDKPGKEVIKSDKPASLDKSAKSDKPAVADKPAKSDKPAVADKPAKSDKPAVADKSAKSDKPAKSAASEPPAEMQVFTSEIAASKPLIKLKQIELPRRPE
jgi:hypothetical protein